LPGDGTPGNVNEPSALSSVVATTGSVPPVAPGTTRVTVTPVGSSTSIEPVTSTGTPMILIGTNLVGFVGSFVLLSVSSIGVASAGSVVSPYHSTFTPDPLSFNL